MSYKNRFLEPSFRGVPFRVDRHSISGGRRAVPTEFISRDTPFTDDMGRRVRVFSVSGYLIGENFDIQALALRAALESRGPGTLVHPWFGIHRVVCDGFGFDITREKGGMATFTADFYERGSVSPRPARAIGPALTLASTALRSAAVQNLRNLVF